MDTIISSLSVLVAIIGVVANLLWQSRLEDRRQRQELFKDRFELYNTLLEYAGSLEGQPVIDNDYFARYEDARFKAKFLFSKKSMNYYAEHIKALHILLHYEPKTFTEDGWTVDDSKKLNFETALADTKATFETLKSAIEEELTLVPPLNKHWQTVLRWVDRSSDLTNKDATNRIKLE